VERVVDVFVAVMMVGICALIIVRPVVVLQWARRAHPQVAEDDANALSIVRLVGVGGLFVTGFFLLVVLQSLWR